MRGRQLPWNKRLKTRYERAEGALDSLVYDVARWQDLIQTARLRIELGDTNTQRSEHLHV